MEDPLLCMKPRIFLKHVQRMRSKISRTMALYSHGQIRRCVVSLIWIEEGLLGHVEFSHPGCLSDYAYGVVTLLEANERPKTPFMFFNMWTHHPTYLDTVKLSGKKRLEEQSNINSSLNCTILSRS